MAKEWFRACGVLVLLGGAWVVWTVLTLRRECHPAPLPPHANLRLAAFAVAATAVGFGLLYLRKWAAAIFAVVSTLVGAWLMASLLRGVPYPWTLINLAIGAALLFPAAVVLRYWSLLSWGRRRLR
jgi:hypothetical protein